jgi:putative ABC transport system ATP-binding protein
MIEHVIQLENVFKYYKMGDTVVKALDGVTIHAHKGDFIAIMGPSGSGKSTGMNLVGSLDWPTKGKIILDNKNILSLDESDLAQVRGKKIGFIFQGFNLIPNLTAKENIMLPMIFQDMPEEEREARAIKLLTMVELEDRMDHYPSQLSGGQQQRVAIARSLANDPEVILADEPTGNLDTATGEKVMDFLNELNKKGKTIVMVTHSPELAHEHARRIYWLKDGKVVKITRKVKDKWTDDWKQRND